MELTPWTPGTTGNAIVFGSIDNPGVASWATVDGSPHHWEVAGSGGIGNFIACEIAPDGGVSVLYGDPTAADDVVKRTPGTYKAQGGLNFQQFGHSGSFEAALSPAEGFEALNPTNPLASPQNELRTPQTLPVHDLRADALLGPDRRARDDVHAFIGDLQHGLFLGGPSYHGPIYDEMQARGMPWGKHVRGLIHPDGTYEYLRPNPDHDFAPVSETLQSMGYKPNDGSYNFDKWAAAMPTIIGNWSPASREEIAGDPYKGRTPFIYDGDQNVVYIGTPGLHHDDLRFQHPELTSSLQTEGIITQGLSDALERDRWNDGVEWTIPDSGPRQVLDAISHMTGLPVTEDDPYDFDKFGAWGYQPMPRQTPEELAQGRSCYFHPNRPAVRAEGFAAMCEDCARRYDETRVKTAGDPKPDQSNEMETPLQMKIHPQWRDMLPRDEYVEMMSKIKRPGPGGISYSTGEFLPSVLRMHDGRQIEFSPNVSHNGALLRIGARPEHVAEYGWYNHDGVYEAAGDQDYYHKDFENMGPQFDFDRFGHIATTEGQPKTPPGLMPWEPGMFGKGFTHNGQTYTWAVDEAGGYGGPHHGDAEQALNIERHGMLGYQGDVYFDIEPDGTYQKAYGDDLQFEFERFASTPFFPGKVKWIGDDEPHLNPRSGQSFWYHPDKGVVTGNTKVHHWDMIPHLGFEVTDEMQHHRFNAAQEEGWHQAWLGYANGRQFVDSPKPEIRDAIAKHIGLPSTDEEDAKFDFNEFGGQGVHSHQDNGRLATQCGALSQGSADHARQEGGSDDGVDHGAVQDAGRCMPEAGQVQGIRSVHVGDSGSARIARWTWTCPEGHSYSGTECHVCGKQDAGHTHWEKQAEFDFEPDEYEDGEKWVWANGKVYLGPAYQSHQDIEEKYLLTDQPGMAYGVIDPKGGVEFWTNEDNGTASQIIKQLQQRPGFANVYYKPGYDYGHTVAKTSEWDFDQVHEPQYNWVWTDGKVLLAPAHATHGEIAPAQDGKGYGAVDEDGGVEFYTTEDPQTMRAILDQIKYAIPQAHFAKQSSFDPDYGWLDEDEVKEIQNQLEVHHSQMPARPENSEHRPVMYHRGRGIGHRLYVGQPGQVHQDLRDEFAHMMTPNTFPYADYSKRPEGYFEYGVIAPNNHLHWYGRFPGEDSRAHSEYEHAQAINNVLGTKPREYGETMPDICPTCKGSGMDPDEPYYHTAVGGCPDCGGTGRQRKNETWDFERFAKTAAYQVLNADGVKVAEYEELAHALESAQENAAAGFISLRDFYTVADPTGREYGSWESLSDGEGRARKMPESEERSAKISGNMQAGVITEQGLLTHPNARYHEDLVSLGIAHPSDLRDGKRVMVDEQGKVYEAIDHQFDFESCHTISHNVTQDRNLPPQVDTIESAKTLTRSDKQIGDVDSQTPSDSPRLRHEPRQALSSFLSSLASPSEPERYQTQANPLPTEFKPLEGLRARHIMIGPYRDEHPDYARYGPSVLRFKDGTQAEWSNGDPHVQALDNMGRTPEDVQTYGWYENGKLVRYDRPQDYQDIWDEHFASVGNPCPACGQREYEHSEGEDSEGRVIRYWHCNACGHHNEDTGLHLVNNRAKPGYAVNRPSSKEFLSSKSIREHSEILDSKFSDEGLSINRGPTLARAERDPSENLDEIFSGRVYHKADSGWTVQQGTTTSKNTLHRDGIEYDHMPILINEDDKHLYIGKPGTHHVDLHEEFDPGYNYPEAGLSPHKDGWELWNYAPLPFGVTEAMEGHTQKPIYSSPYDFTQMSKVASDAIYDHIQKGFQPGSPGKALVYPGRVVAWNTWANEGPHHQEVHGALCRNENILTTPMHYVDHITPQGEIEADPGFARYHPLLRGTGLKLVQPQGEDFERFAAGRDPWQEGDPIEPWDFGRKGKGIILNGEPHLWATNDIYDGPHHHDVAQTVDPDWGGYGIEGYFHIGPDGTVEAEGHGDSFNFVKHDPRLRLSPRDKLYDFESKVSDFWTDKTAPPSAKWKPPEIPADAPEPEVIEHGPDIATSSEFNMYGHLGRRPIVYDPVYNKIHIGLDMEPHNTLVNRVPDDISIPSGTRSHLHGWLGHNPEITFSDNTTRGEGTAEYGWYGDHPGPHVDEALRKHFNAEPGTDIFDFEHMSARTPTIRTMPDPVGDTFTQKAYAGRKAFLYYPAHNTIYMGSDGAHHEDIKNHFNLPWTRNRSFGVAQIAPSQGFGAGEIGVRGVGVANPKHQHAFDHLGKLYNIPVENLKDTHNQIWNFESKASTDFPVVYEHQTPEPPEYMTWGGWAERRPIIYIPEYNSVHVGNKASTHTELRQTVKDDMGIHVPYLKRDADQVYEGWLGHNPEGYEGSGDTMTNQGLHNEYGWYTRHPGPHVDAALAVHFKAQPEGPDYDFEHFAKTATTINGDQPFGPVLYYPETDNFYCHAPITHADYARNGLLQDGDYPHSGIKGWISSKGLEWLGMREPEAHITQGIADQLGIKVKAPHWDFESKTANIQIHTPQDPGGGWEPTPPHRVVSLAMIYDPMTDKLHVGSEDEVHHEDIWPHTSTDEQGYHVGYPGWIEPHDGKYQFYDSRMPEEHKQRAVEHLQTHMGKPMAEEGSVDFDKFGAAIPNEQLPTIVDHDLSTPVENHGTDDRPWIYDPKDNVIHLGPDNWYHMDMIRKINPLYPNKDFYRGMAHGRTSDYFFDTMAKDPERKRIQDALINYTGRKPAELDFEHLGKSSAVNPAGLKPPHDDFKPFDLNEIGKAMVHGPTGRIFAWGSPDGILSDENPHHTDAKMLLEHTYGLPSTHEGKEAWGDYWYEPNSGGLQPFGSVARNHLPRVADALGVNDTGFAGYNFEHFGAVVSAPPEIDQPHPLVYWPHTGEIRIGLPYQHHEEVEMSGPQSDRIDHVPHRAIVRPGAVDWLYHEPPSDHDSIDAELTYHYGQPFETTNGFNFEHFAKTAGWKDDHRVSPFDKNVQPWTPAELGKGLVSPEGRAYTWAIDKNHGRDGYPSHDQALKSLGGPDLNKAMDDGWSFYGVGVDGSYDQLVGEPHHDAVMKAHLPQEPFCWGCGNPVQTDRDGAFKCLNCKLTGDTEIGRQQGLDFEHFAKTADIDWERAPRPYIPELDEHPTATAEVHQPNGWTDPDSQRDQRIMRSPFWVQADPQRENHYHVRLGLPGTEHGSIYNVHDSGYDDWHNVASGGIMPAGSGKIGPWGPSHYPDDTIEFYQDYMPSPIKSEWDADQHYNNTLDAVQEPHAFTGDELQGIVDTDSLSDQSRRESDAMHRAVEHALRDHFKGHYNFDKAKDHTGPLDFERYAAEASEDWILEDPTLDDLEPWKLGSEGKGIITTNGDIVTWTEPKIHHQQVAQLLADQGVQAKTLLDYIHPDGVALVESGDPADDELVKENGMHPQHIDGPGAFNFEGYPLEAEYVGLND